jgi:hypothetical protein
VARIGRYIAGHAYMHRWKSCEKDCIYGKDILFLPKEFYGDNDFVVVTIKPYNLIRTKATWGDYWQFVTLECHFNKAGDINIVYYPL